MKKGFTLIELMIVIIIIGVLATIGIVQYQSAVEKSRGAEAKSVIGYLRQACATRYMETQNTADCNAAALNLGQTLGTNIPTTACLGTNYFRYTAAAVGATAITLTAIRCSGAGKEPQGPATNPTLILDANYATGADVWSGTGNYR